MVWASTVRIWAELHEQAFRCLGGATATVVLDNLREGVLKPDVYDPLLNPLYRDVLAHYGAVALPCRVRDPDRKGKVERGVGQVIFADARIEQPITRALAGEGTVVRATARARMRAE